MLTLEGVTLRHDAFQLEARFSVPKGARVAVIGPSGAGKSTLLAAIAGFQPLAAGRVVWDGEDMSAFHPGARPMSILFQDNNLFPHLSVADNVGLGLRPDLRLSRAEADRVAAVLARVGLEGLGDRKPRALSGGQAGRVALARVLLRARPLMLLDEPFAALGPGLRQDMLDLVADLCAEIGATLLMVSHDPEDARRIADHIVFVEDGKAEAPAPTEQLFAAPSEALARYLGSRPPK